MIEEALGGSGSTTGFVLVPPLHPEARSNAQLAAEVTNVLLDTVRSTFHLLTEECGCGLPFRGQDGYAPGPWSIRFQPDGVIDDSVDPQDRGEVDAEVTCLGNPVRDDPV